MKKHIKLIKFSLLVILLFCFNINIEATNNSEQWSKQYGGTGDDHLYSIVQTSDGGFIATGITYGSVGGNTNLGDSDGWILKIASDGSEEWSKQYGGTNYDYFHQIEQTSDGGFIVAGYTDGSVGGNTNLGSSDGWILKIASDGSEQWSKQYGGTGDDYLYSIVQTSDGGFIATGITYSSVGGNTNLGSGDGWVLKIASDGSEEWSKQYGGADFDTLNSIKQTSDGGFIAAGVTYDSVGGNTNLGFADAWILKIAHNGAEQWSKQYGGTKNDFLSSIQQTNDRGFIATGFTNGSVGGNTNLGGNDGWILKITSDGNEEWSKQYGGTDADSLDSIQQTSDGGFIAAGYTYGIDGWVLKIASDGNKEWSKQYGGNSADILNSIQQTSDGGYIAAGVIDQGDTNLGGVDGWIIKLNEQFNLDFNLNGADGTVPIEQKIFVGELATKPNDPTRNNYTFKGWNTKTDGSGTTWDFTKTTMPTNNVILYAQWELKTIPTTKYELSFNLNGASGKAPIEQTVSVGKLATKPNDPTRNNYTFKGWNTKANGSGTTWDFTKTTMPTNNVILYAQWQLKEINPLPGAGSNLSTIIYITMAITTAFSVIYIKKRKL